jgi:hypothetical protein
MLTPDSNSESQHDFSMARIRRNHSTIFTLKKTTVTNVTKRLAYRT